MIKKKYNFKATNTPDLIDKGVDVFNTHPKKDLTYFCVICGQEVKGSAICDSCRKEDEKNAKAKAKRTSIKTIKEILQNQIFRTKCDFSEEEYWHIYQAMRKYAKQYATQPLPCDITDEDIEKYADALDFGNSHSGKLLKRNWIFGAIAMKNGQIKPTK